jgi:acetoin utilization deacetylase AcuC-like enzyme
LKSEVFDSEVVFFDYFEKLKQEVHKIEKPDLFIFLAGYDLWEEDFITDVHFTCEELVKRDGFILKYFRDVPTVLLPGGGYGLESWKITELSIKHYVKEIY